MAILVPTCKLNWVMVCFPFRCKIDNIPNNILRNGNSIWQAVFMYMLRLGNVVMLVSGAVMYLLFCDLLPPFGFYLVSEHLLCD